MDVNFGISLSHVLSMEGGWVDHPRDPGGATMRGVTLETFRHFYGRDRTKRELRAITSEQLAAIYRRGYWDPVQAGALPSGLDLAVFDAAVNSGPARSVKWLQAALGTGFPDLPVDGVMGPRTLAAVDHTSHLAAELVDLVVGLRLEFLRGLDTWDVFGRGWKRRVEGTRVKALRLTRSFPASGS